MLRRSSTTIKLTPEDILQYDDQQPMANQLKILNSLPTSKLQIPPSQQISSGVNSKIIPMVPSSSHNSNCSFDNTDNSNVLSKDGSVSFVDAVQQSRGKSRDERIGIQSRN